MTRTPKQYLDDSNLTDEVLRDLARNESASKPMRKEATRLLLSRRSPHAKHEDLREFVAEIKGEAEAHQEVVAIVESATEAPFEPASNKIEFSPESVADGYWEVYHDDDCDGVITPYPDNLCLKCGMHPDFQSRGARRTSKPFPPAENPALKASFTTASF